MHTCNKRCSLTNRSFERHSNNQAHFTFNIWDIKSPSCDVQTFNAIYAHVFSSSIFDYLSFNFKQGEFISNCYGGYKVVRFSLWVYSNCPFLFVFIYILIVRLFLYIFLVVFVFRGAATLSLSTFVPLWFMIQPLLVFAKKKSAMPKLNNWRNYLKKKKLTWIFESSSSSQQAKKSYKPKTKDLAQNHRQCNEERAE